MPDDLHLLAARLGRTWLALDQRDIVEVLGPQTVLRVPGVRPDTPGLIAFRGRAILCLDLQPLLSKAAGLAASAPPNHRLSELGAAAAARRPPRACTLIACPSADLWLALPVDEVREAIAVPSGDLHPASAGSPRAIRAEADMHGDRLPLLDLRSALPPTSRGMHAT